jgi:hypothetical protein
LRDINFVLREESRLGGHLKFSIHVSTEFFKDLTHNIWLLRIRNPDSDPRGLAIQVHAHQETGSGTPSNNLSNPFSILGVPPVVAKAEELVPAVSDSRDRYPLTMFICRGCLSLLSRWNLPASPRSVG